MPVEFVSALRWSLTSEVELICDGDVATAIAVLASSEKRKTAFAFFTWIPIRYWVELNQFVGC
jgi:hypothetical protein